MSKFMFVFRGGGYASSSLVSPTELQAHLAKWTAWSGKMAAAGQLVSGTPLEHPATGKTVRGRDAVVMDGPYAESKELVSGIVIVEALSLDDAAAIARGCPILETAGGTVEVRPVLAVHHG